MGLSDGSSMEFNDPSQERIENMPFDEAPSKSETIDESEKEQGGDFEEKAMTDSVAEPRPATEMEEGICEPIPSVELDESTDESGDKIENKPQDEMTQAKTPTEAPVVCTAIQKAAFHMAPFDKSNLGTAIVAYAKSSAWKSRWFEDQYNSAYKLVLVLMWMSMSFLLDVNGKMSVKLVRKRMEIQKQLMEQGYVNRGDMLLALQQASAGQGLSDH
jgi:hypothetical protein